MLAGAGLGISIANVFCMSIMCGVNAAAQTLASQAYGAGDLHRVGVIHNRGRTVLTAFFIPLAILLCFTENILVAIGQDPQVAHVAHRFIMMTLPGYYFAGLMDLSRLILNSMQLTYVPMLATGTATISHLFWCYILIVRLGLGIEGCGIATAITFLVQLVVVTIYPYFVADIRSSLVQFTLNDCFTGWKEYLAISAPATLMTCAEWWCFEIMIILSGYVGVPDEGAQVILLSILGVLFMIALGMQEATVTLVGNTIGAN
jgi:multidrug resistance protein, MATE family